MIQPGRFRYDRSLREPRKKNRWIRRRRDFATRSCVFALPLHFEQLEDRRVLATVSLLPTGGGNARLEYIGEPTEVNHVVISQTETTVSIGVVPTVVDEFGVKDADDVIINPIPPCFGGTVPPQGASCPAVDLLVGVPVAVLTVTEVRVLLDDRDDSVDLRALSINSKLVGGAGNDVFVGARALNTVDGGPGNDSILVEGTSANDTIS